MEQRRRRVQPLLRHAERLRCALHRVLCSGNPSPASARRHPLPSTAGSGCDHQRFFLNSRHARLLSQSGHRGGPLVVTAFSNRAAAKRTGPQMETLFNQHPPMVAHRWHTELYERRRLRRNRAPAPRSRSARMPAALSAAIKVQLIKRRATALNAAAKHARDDLAAFRARSEQRIIDGERRKPAAVLTKARQSRRAQ